MVPVTILGGFAIFGALWVITSSIAFWTVETQEVANSFTYGGNFITQYPLDVFERVAAHARRVHRTARVRRTTCPRAWMLDKPTPPGSRRGPRSCVAASSR